MKDSYHGSVPEPGPIPDRGLIWYLSSGSWPDFCWKFPDLVPFYQSINLSRSESYIYAYLICMEHYCEKRKLWRQDIIQFLWTKCLESDFHRYRIFLFDMFRSGVEPKTSLLQDLLSLIANMACLWMVDFVFYVSSMLSIKYKLTCSFFFIISGEGVFATKAFSEGEFLLEYKGDLISSFKHATQLEKEYAEADLGCFMYFFKCRNKTMW